MSRPSRLWAAALAAVCALTAAPGCAPVLIGAGVVGGYAISKDTVENHFERSPGRVFQASLNALRETGVVILQDETHGRIQGTVGDSKITITIDPLTDTTVRLRVKARNKFLMPDIEQAQMLHNRIFAALR